MPLTVSVEVPPRDREVLASWVRSPSIRAGLAQRARIVLLAADGAGTNEIASRTGVWKPTVISWKRRYAAGGVGGLEDRPKPGKPRTTDDVGVVLATLEPPPQRLGVSHWSSRLLAAELGLSNVKVARVWREDRPQPGREGGVEVSPPPPPDGPKPRVPPRLPQPPPQTAGLCGLGKTRASPCPTRRPQGRGSPGPRSSSRPPPPRPSAAAASPR